MTDDDYRPLTAQERKIFNKLLSVSFPGRDELMKQLADLKVKPIDQNGSLDLTTSLSTRALVTRRIPIEARYIDREPESSDGIYVHVLLHVVNGMMKELEIYKDDGSPILNRPIADELELITY